MEKHNFCVVILETEMVREVACPHHFQPATLSRLAAVKFLGNLTLSQSSDFGHKAS